MSYGINAPQGLQPNSFLGGAAWNQATSTYPITSAYGTSIFSGDIVMKDLNGTIVRSASTDGDAIVGVFWGCSYISAVDGRLVESKWWPANTAVFNGETATAYIIDDPNVLFDVQCGDAAIVPIHTDLRLTDLGKNCSLTVVDGSTTTGISASYLNLNTAVGAGGPEDRTCRIVRLTPGTMVLRQDFPLLNYTGNQFGMPFNNATVLINNHAYKAGTEGV